ncbi:MAG: CPBP family intramembrane glutamic endopeptidase [Pseudomonadota bacterium]|jgi:membrane protease YdiL (CAAX protease family)
MVKITKSIEIFVFFIIIPIILIPTKSNIAMFSTLTAVAIICIYYLKYKKITLINLKDFKFDKYFKIIFYRFLIVAILVLIFSYFFDPSKFLNLPRSHFFLWLLIIILYPILSALPQEIVFRSFFFKRYENLFKNKKILILVNAFLFSFAHIIYLNPIVILFTFIGGLMMAESYSKHNSLIKVSIEHGLYGDIVFTSGLGAYFYHAQGLTIG